MSDELKEKYNVGKLIKLSSDPGQTSTDDMQLSSEMANPYMSNSGLTGTETGMKKMIELEDVVVDIVSCVGWLSVL